MDHISPSSNITFDTFDGLKLRSSIILLTTILIIAHCLQQTYYVFSIERFDPEINEDNEKIVEFLRSLDITTQERVANLELAMDQLAHKHYVRMDIDLYIPRLMNTGEQCRSGTMNDVFIMSRDTDQRTNKYITDDILFDVDQNRLPQERCLLDLLDTQNVTNPNDIRLPPAKPDIQIPFFILPETLPVSAKSTGSTKWSECWSEYDKIAPKLRAHEWVKKTYGYHVARQLESHPWRVYNPDEALIYIIPWMDYIGTYDAPSECKSVFHTTNVDEAISKAKAEYPDHLTSSNTIIFTGDYTFVNRWWDRKWPFATEAKKSVDYRMEQDDFQPIISSFYPSPIRQAVRSTMVFHPSPISEVCFNEIDKPECVRHEERIEYESQMTLDEWKFTRPIKFASFGQTWNRPGFSTRRSMSAAIHLLNTNGYDTRLPKPFIYMTHNVSKQPEDLISTCSNNMSTRISQVMQPWREGNIDELRTDDIPSIAWDIAPQKKRSDKVSGSYPLLPDIVSRKQQDKIRRHTQYVVSLRGGTGHSQRSYEGLYFGMLTHHDQSEEHFSYYTILPSNLPWRLLGVWNNNLCINQLTNNLIRHSGRHEISFLNSVEVEAYTERLTKHFKKEYEDRWSDDDLLRWAQDFIKCFEPFMELVTDEKHAPLMELMRQSIYHYRADVLWEVPDSRAAENVIFEAARLMNRHDPVVLRRFESKKPKHQTWESLGLTEASFKSTETPASCMLSSGNSVYERSWGKWNSDLYHQMKDVLNEARMFFPDDEHQFYYKE